MRVECREDCKGLCPICGKDLNDGDCGCDRTIRDPRFESLRALFNDDEETETFTGDQIDLADYVKRGIIGELPMRVECREDCKGLCPICGKDLNDGDCGCDRTIRDPRFESLRALFNDDEEV